MKKIVLTGIIIVFFCYSCLHSFKAGNLVSLDYPINTKLSFRVINQYLDTLTMKGGYEPPEKWITRKKLENLDSLNNRRIYFSKPPEEMYEISFNGQLVLLDVFNEQINKFDWVSNREKMSKDDDARVKKRMQFLLDTIESLAKRDGLPDSVVHFNKSW